MNAVALFTLSVRGRPPMCAMRRLAIVCTLGALTCSSGATPPPGTVYTGHAVAIAKGLLLTDGGTLVCGAGARHPMGSTNGVVQLTYSGVPLAQNGDVFELHCMSGASAVPSVWASGVAEVIGPNVFRRADGSTFFQVNDQFWDLPTLDGATSCNRHVCVKGGAILLNARTYDSSYLPALGTPPPGAAVAQSFNDVSGVERLLTASGQVFDVDVVESPPTLVFVPLQGLPPVVRMDGTFLYDKDGNAYYAGYVWAPESTTRLGLSTTMLPAGTRPFACPAHPVKILPDCVSPTLVPRLAGAAMGSVYGVATYALMSDGHVECWATEPTVPPMDVTRCLRFE